MLEENDATERVDPPHSDTLDKYERPPVASRRQIQSDAAAPEQHVQNGWTIARMTIPVASTPGTSLIRRNCRPLKPPFPSASFLE